MSAKVHIGTSGYSFDDWQFYPRGLPRRDRLSYYALFFDALELNVTFYRRMPPDFAEGALRSAPELLYVVKMHSDVTHERTDVKEAIRSFSESVEPFARAGRFAGTLLQFPFSFRSNEPAREHVRSTGAALRQIGPVFVEFRHRTWYNVETWDLLSAEGLSVVSVDLPRLPGLPPTEPVVIGRIAYLRLHGRNAGSWWGEGDRYDYRYGESEISQIAQTVEDVSGKSAEVFVFFNNCHLGSAPVNATELARALGLTLGTSDPDALAKLYPPAAQTGLFGGDG
jgi:uncharacterized protein YecE (DUF72 family)